MKLLDIILILFLLCCILKNKEGFSIAGQLIIPPLQYRILQPTTSYYETSICEDDNNWTNGDLKCGDYFIEGYDCEDIGDDGQQAFEACKRTCDNCPVDVKLKETDNKMLDRFPDKRIPSPVSELDNFDFADYGEFDGMMGSGSDVGMNAELYSKIDDLTTIVEELKGSQGNMDFMGGGSSTGGFTSCPGDLCYNPNEFNPTECNSRIKGPHFKFGTDLTSDNKSPLQCGNETVKANVSKVIGEHIDKNIYYDCENKSWVVQNGDNYEPYTFHADYTCHLRDDGTSTVSADCIQEWGDCESNNGICQRTYQIKSNQVGTDGITCRDLMDVPVDKGDGNPDFPGAYLGSSHCASEEGGGCRNIDILLGASDPEVVEADPLVGGDPESLMTQEKACTDLGVGFNWIDGKCDTSGMVAAAGLAAGAAQRDQNSRSGFCANVPSSDSNFKWVLQTRSETCTDTCLNDGRSCQDGDWGADSEPTMIEALVNAALENAGVPACEEYRPIPQTYPDNNPIVKGNMCHYSNPGHPMGQICNMQPDNDENRLCKCTPRTTHTLYHTDDPVSYTNPDACRGEGNWQRISQKFCLYSGTSPEPPPMIDTVAPINYTCPIEGETIQLTLPNPDDHENTCTWECD